MCKLDWGNRETRYQTEARNQSTVSFYIMIAKTELTTKRCHPVVFNMSVTRQELNHCFLRIQDLLSDNEWSLSSHKAWSLREGELPQIPFPEKKSLFHNDSQLSKHKTPPINILELKTNAGTLPGFSHLAIDIKLVQATYNMWPETTNHSWSSRCRKKVPSSCRLHKRLFPSHPYFYPSIVKSFSSISWFCCTYLFWLSH